MSSAKWRPFYHGFNVLTRSGEISRYITTHGTRHTQTELKGCISLIHAIASQKFISCGDISNWVNGGLCIGLVLNFISPLCRIYASVDCVSIGSDNGLWPMRRQAISKYNYFHSRKCTWKYRLRNGGHFVQGEIIQQAIIINNYYKDDQHITVKPVCNDHPMGHFSAFWSSSRWPRAT